jgi:cation:H+ antiporter
MIVALAWCIAGILIVIAGAEIVVRAGADLAARLGVSSLVIGLTVVALGTSTPELAVGIDAALQGSGSLAVGNIAGTNTFNLLFILGLSAWIAPLALRMQTLRFDLPIMMASAVALMVLSWDGVLTRTEGTLMVAAAMIYTLAVIRVGRRESRAVKARYVSEFAVPRRERGERQVIRSLAALITGIAVIVVGADWLVDGAVALARSLGVSDALIGLTVVAIGTSMPELVTTIVGTLRKERDIAIGNLLGSSIYNILVILGITSLVSSSGMHIDPELIRIDIPVMTAVACICAPVFLSGGRVARIEGAVFVGAYIAYLTYLVATRT